MNNESNNIKNESKVPDALIENLILLSHFEIQALHLNSKINIKKTKHKHSAKNETMILSLNGGLCFVFAYGVIVYINLCEQEQNMILDYLTPCFRSSIKSKEHLLDEHLWVNIKPDLIEEIEQNTISLQSLNQQHLELIVQVLFKSIILEFYENTIVANFEYVEPIAKQLLENGNLSHNANELLKHIGASLIAEHNMIGNIAITEKPALLWEHTELDELYGNLISDLEIFDRKKILDQKIELISRTAQTSLDILQHKHASRLEWYIIILIIASIALETYVVFGLGLS